MNISPLAQKDLLSPNVAESSLTMRNYFPLKPHDSLITYYFEITWLTKNMVSTTTMPMTTKLGKLMTYHEGLLTIKSQDPLIT